MRPVVAGDPKSYDTAKTELASLLDALGDREDDDIAIRPFSVSIGGFTVGLLVDPDGDYADLVPVGIRFSEPWDGGYST